MWLRKRFCLWLHLCVLLGLKLRLGLVLGPQLQLRLPQMGIGILLWLQLCRRFLGLRLHDRLRLWVQLILDMMRLLLRLKRLSLLHERLLHLVGLRHQQL
mmetsp:Transcript_48987/g.141974  ORF Transcript_48987/g.141974 Transcript_48987/m.141974 type:complete len:100 (-) Transcript_48987:36-335(-)